MDIDISHNFGLSLLLFELQISALMADDVSCSQELVLFVSVLLLVPLLFAHPLGLPKYSPARHLLDHSVPPPPPETAVATTITAGDHGGQFMAADHEVPSGANPDSNR
ncbi:hypothetical protein L6452_23842 [Arctium lappa]|uniref:Uncharacterized protein n=1 Tax=Arctium lappa TaxID=4217 RepID=A0ACB9A7R9_ARCLA|nr:hypothetical protein L6452_23842 [Arctium lappa]